MRKWDGKWRHNGTTIAGATSQPGVLCCRVQLPDQRIESGYRLNEGRIAKAKADHTRWRDEPQRILHYAPALLWQPHSQRP